MDYVRRSIDELRGAPQSESCVRELDDVLRLFVDYPAYEAAFQKPDAEAACAATPSGGVDQEETGDLGCDQVDAQGISGCDQLDVHLQKFSTKPAHLLANFLFDVMAGSLDDTIKAALHGQGARQNNLKEIDFAGKDNMEALRDWKRALGVYKTIVSATAPSTSHPASSAATSGGEDTEELKKHEERKSLVVVGHSHGSAGSETPSSSQGNMQWVERYFPDFDGRVGEDLVIIKGGVDLFVAAISSRKVFQNINAFKKARVLEEHVDKLRANSKGLWVFSYKHMVIDLQLGSPSILAGTEAGRALKRGRSTKSRHGKGEKCCCVLAFARPFAPATGVGRIDLSDGCDSRGCNSRS